MTEAEVIQKAIGILYDMNEFVTDVMDSEYWLTYGVPDGTFDGIASREEAEANFSIYDHLVVTLMSSEEALECNQDKVYRCSKYPAKFDPSDLEEFSSAFVVATDDSAFSDMADRRDEIIEEAKSLLNTYISTGG